MIYARKKNNKMPKFYMHFARKIFFPIFFWGGAPPVSYAYGPISIIENGNGTIQYIVYGFLY